MKNENINKSISDGSISIFLALILVITTALVCTVTESARMFAAKSKMKEMSEAAVQSMFGEYAKELFDDYGLLFMWKSSEELSQSLEQYITHNIEYDSLKGAWDFYGIQLNDIELNTVTFATDNNGEVFSQQIFEFMKYEGVNEGIKILKESYELFENSANIKVTTENIESIAKYKDKLESSVKNINSYIDSIKTTITDINDRLESINNILEKGSVQIDKVKNKFEDIKNKFLDIENEIFDLLEEGELYENCKSRTIESASKVIGYTQENNTSTDYISKNIITFEDLYERLHKLNLQDIEVMDNLEFTKYVEDYNKIIQEVDELKEDSSEKDSNRNKGDFIENIMSLSDAGLLSLLVSDINGLSTSEILDENKVEINKENAGKINDGVSAETISNKALYGLYIKNFFGNYNNVNENSTLQYETEYILSGKNSDKENLEYTCSQLIALREGLNIVYLIGNAEKRQEAYELALSITSAAGIPVLAIALQVMIIATWAMAESIIDVRNLLAGEKVNIVKKEGEWNLSIEGLMNFADSNRIKCKSDSGLDYQMYLQILLYGLDNNKKYYRTMDLIQANMREQYNTEFSLSECVSNINFTAKYSYRKLFLKFPFVKKVVGDDGELYESLVNLSYQY
ncbi:MAG: DUF5702 domain-containing protein [Eubacterium sp.]